MLVCYLIIIYIYIYIYDNQIEKQHVFFNISAVNQKKKKKKTIQFMFNVLTSCLYQKNVTTHNKLIFFTDLLQCYS